MGLRNSIGEGQTEQVPGMQAEGEGSALCPSSREALVQQKGCLRFREMDVVSIDIRETIFNKERKARG